MSPTAVTPTSLISGTVSTNRSSSNEKAKASMSLSYMIDSCDDIETMKGMIHVMKIVKYQI
jgi:hypothetical protein